MTTALASLAGSRVSRTEREMVAALTANLTASPLASLMASLWANLMASLWANPMASPWANPMASLLASPTEVTAPLMANPAHRVGGSCGPRRRLARLAR